MLALSGCAGSTPAHSTTAKGAVDPMFVHLRDANEAQGRRITELESRIALLEQEARRTKDSYKPIETVRISKAQRDEQEAEDIRPTAVIRLHEEQPAEPETPWVLPTAPAGVATRLEVVPMAGDNGAAPAPSDPVVHYREALAMIKARRYDEALAQLAIITRQHPEHTLAAQAQYWKGEAHYAARRYREALIELEAFMKRYPSSAKVPDALLKAGLCNKHLGQDALANRYFDRVRKEHPGSDAAQSAPREGSS
jgi:tol-pal system protein YbgF